MENLKDNNIAAATKQLAGKIFWKDQNGRLVADELVSESDKLRDKTVRKLVENAIEVHRQIKQLKQDMLIEFDSFISYSSEHYNAKIQGKKGGFSITSFNGEYRIRRSFTESLEFDERILAAKSLIDECISEWSKDSTKELKAVVEHAFSLDKDGKLSIYKILGLRRVEIKDDRWINAMKAINDSLQICATKEYIRVYKRDKNGKYQQISLNLASI